MNLLTVKTNIKEIGRELNSKGKRLRIQRKKIIGIIIKQALSGNFNFTYLNPFVKQMEEDQTFCDLLSECLKEFKIMVARLENKPKNRIRNYI